MQNDPSAARSFSACRRRVSFCMDRKKPTAQAAFSWPFGPIHLETHQGWAQNERSRSYSPTPGPRFTGDTDSSHHLLFSARKKGVLGCGSFRAHWGPDQAKIRKRCGFFQAPPVHLPTLSSRPLPGLVLTQKSRWGRGGRRTGPPARAGGTGSPRGQSTWLRWGTFSRRRST